jgi:hypothetical protein
MQVATQAQLLTTSTSMHAAEELLHMQHAAPLFATQRTTDVPHCGK